MKKMSMRRIVSVLSVLMLTVCLLCVSVAPASALEVSGNTQPYWALQSKAVTVTGALDDVNGFTLSGTQAWAARLETEVDMKNGIKMQVDSIPSNGWLCFALSTTPFADSQVTPLPNVTDNATQKRFLIREEEGKLDIRFLGADGKEWTNAEWNLPALDIELGETFSLSYSFNAATNGYHLMANGQRAGGADGVDKDKYTAPFKYLMLTAYNGGTVSNFTLGNPIGTLDGFDSPWELNNAGASGNKIVPGGKDWLANYTGTIDAEKGINFKMDSMPSDWIMVTFGASFIPTPTFNACMPPVTAAQADMYFRYLIRNKDGKLSVTFLDYNNAEHGMNDGKNTALTSIPSSGLHNYAFTKCADENAYCLTIDGVHVATAGNIPAADYFGVDYVCLSGNSPVTLSGVALAKEVYKPSSSDSSNTTKPTKPSDTDNGNTDDGSSDDGSYDDGSSDDNNGSTGGNDGGWTPGGNDDATWDDGSSDDGSSDDGSSDDGSWDDGSSDDGSWDDGSSDDGSWDDGSSDDGSWDDGSYDNGYSDDYYDDGSYDDGSSDDGMTDDGYDDDMTPVGGEDDGTTEDDGSNQGGIPWWIWLIIALIVLLAVAAAVILVIRNRDKLAIKLAALKASFASLFARFKKK